jgi:hypothetical protein
LIDVIIKQIINCVDNQIEKVDNNKVYFDEKWFGCSSEVENLIIQAVGCKS